MPCPPSGKLPKDHERQRFHKQIGGTNVLAELTAVSHIVWAA